MTVAHKEVMLMYPLHSQNRIHCEIALAGNDHDVDIFDTCHKTPPMV